MFIGRLKRITYVRVKQEEVLNVLNHYVSYFVSLTVDDSQGEHQPDCVDRDVMRIVLVLIGAGLGFGQVWTSVSSAST